MRDFMYNSQHTAVEGSILYRCYSSAISLRPEDPYKQRYCLKSVAPSQGHVSLPAVRETSFVARPIKI